MAVAHTDADLMRYLKALGMPDNCVKFTIIAELDSPVMAEAVFYPDVEKDGLITKHFVLANP